MNVRRNLLAAAAAMVLLSCRQDMHDPPRYRPLAASEFFADGRASRPRIADTVARGQLRLDEALYKGRTGGELVDRIPIQVTRATLERGRERFDIFCSVCHGQLGDGDGMVVQRGFRPPPSFHLDRLRRRPVGHYFDVMTNGFGAMASYASRVPVEDRWAIAAYIRALQLSQNATIDDVPAGDRAKLEGR